MFEVVIVKSLSLDSGPVDTKKKKHFEQYLQLTRISCVNIVSFKNILFVLLF